jgi:hypothetical protein
MSIITKISENQGKDKDRVYVYIDNIYCASIRQRTWIGMNLTIGSSISCEDLKTLEQNFWKKLYGKESWEQEKVRINRVCEWFKHYIPTVEIVPIGLGADSNEYFENIHSEEKGSPDLSIRTKDSDIELIALEVSGTENMKGMGYWVRKDKIDYIQAHKERDIWIVLHYQRPKEKFIWLKINSEKQYQAKTLNFKGADEYYVIFNDKDSEIS